MRIYIAQLNPTVGDLSGNEQMIRRAYRRGADAGAEIVVVPELAVTGYPPRDLLERVAFVEASLRVSDDLARMTEETALVFGCITRNTSSAGKPLHNAAVVAQNGAVVFEQPKRLLPTYDIFDERRHFEPGTAGGVVELHGRRIGISVCEDLWFEHRPSGRRLYATDPLESLDGQNCELLVNISASPFNVQKRHLRHQVFRRVAHKHRIPIVYVNQVGGNDELLFDGSSVVFDDRGDPAFCSRSFAEDEALVTVDGTVGAC
ncbi:MAG TPA: nitrilase-related carbon-nitrogen hydrolase, partial [Gaiellaceae bacterium]|nr:nitrilase-related carbon-nitrogen hydrolase [Gaiellaceae bacterium]